MVRDLFVMARQHAPSIIFMDEIDSIGGARSESSGGDSEVQRTMLELLNQLDGFEPAQNIKVLMATNRLDILDPALLRPGRIDRKIEFPNPNEAARLHIVKIHSRKMNLVRGINLKRVANQMKGASGAESKAVCTEAGMFALRERRVHVTQEDFEMAVAKVMKKDVSIRARILSRRAFEFFVRVLIFASAVVFLRSPIAERQGHVASPVLEVSKTELDRAASRLSYCVYHHQLLALAVVAARVVFVSPTYRTSRQRNTYIQNFILRLLFDSS